MNVVCWDKFKNKWQKEESHLKYILYEVIDSESGQCAKGTAADLSELIGVKKSRISYLAKENGIYR